MQQTPGKNKEEMQRTYHIYAKKTIKTMHICQKFVKTIKKSKTHINKKHCKMQNTYENSFKQIAKPTTKKKKPHEHQLLFRPHGGIASAQGPHVFAANMPQLRQQQPGVRIQLQMQGN